MSVVHDHQEARSSRRCANGSGARTPYFGYLFSCPYCTSHWIAFALVPLTGAWYLKVPYDWGWVSAALTWFLSSILVTMVSAFLRVAFFFVDQTQGLIRRRQKHVETVIEEVEHRIERDEQPRPPRIQ